MKLGNKIEDRFVAFVDILGFKNILARVEENFDSEEFKRLESVLNFMNEETHDPNYSADLPVYEKSECGEFLIEKELGDPRLTYISDCIIISAEPTLDGFKGLSRKIHKITADLAYDGIFCRGAISKGKMYHQQRVLFGSAYLRAYYLEENEARFPRVIIDPNILEFFDLSDGKMPLAPIFYGKDRDDYYYLRYWTWYLFPPYAISWEAYLLHVRQKILACLSEHADTPPVLKKYEWLSKEFNELIDFWFTPFDVNVDTKPFKIEKVEQGCARNSRGCASSV